MSPHQVPPLRNGATDIDSDSDYLGTPVDPPASCQPYVADYAPLANYYYSPEAYEGAEYAVGRSEDPLGLPGNSEYGGPSPHHGLLLQTPYPATAPEGCSQPADTTIAAYPLIPPSLLPSSALNVDTAVHLSRSGLVASRDSSFTPTSQRDSPRTHYGTPTTTRYPDRDGDDVDRGSKDTFMSMYSKASSQQPDDVVNAPGSYTLLPYSLDAAVPTSRIHYGSGTYHDENYAESPIDESGYCDRISEQVCDYTQRVGYDQYQPHPQPNMDTLTHAGFSLSKGQHVRLFQPPSCPYSYPRFESSGELLGYGPHSISSSRHYIHAPRPQQVHDIHNLHNSTCPSDDMSSALLPPHHRVLSIPSIPAPPPIPRPSSLIEDSPKKPLTLACFFCRKRKIACQSPPAGSLDRTCNQCSKRKLKCVYPATSRRGIRPRVYDLADDVFRRPSVSVSL